MRPKLPSHLSLHRTKSSSSTHTPDPAATPPRNNEPLPLRTPGVEKDDMQRKKGATPAQMDEQRGNHQNMGLILKVQVQKGRGLAPKDKSGTSDPYLVITVGDKKEATSAISKTLNPEWNQTFEFPVVSAESALLEAVCWDKDRFKKDYMGEFDVMIEDLFAAGNTSPEPRWFKLESRRSGKKQKKKDDNVSGEVLLRFKLYNPLDTSATPQQILQRFYGVVAADAAEEAGSDSDDDDELLSRLNSRDLDDVSEGEEDEDQASSSSNEKDTPDDEGTRTPGGTMILDPSSTEKQRHRRRQKLRKLKRKSKMKAYEFSGMTDVSGVLFLEINRIRDLPPERNMTKTGFDMDPFVVTSLGKKTYRTKVVNHNLNPVYDEKLVFQVQKHELNYSLSFAVVDRDKFSGNDFVGTALFPVEKVRSLAPEADAETGLYKLPDPDAVTDAETRRRKWRVPMSRSSSQVPSRSSSQTNLNKLTKTTSNTSLSNMAIAGDVGPSKPGLVRQDSDSSFTDRQRRPNVDERSRRPTGPTSQPSAFGSTNGGYGGNDQLADGSNDESGLYHYELPLELKNKSRWEEKHHPTLFIRVKYLPYDALRQQFWRVMLRQYDADESGKLDKVELVTMLDTLGSTLHNSTIDRFFKRYQVENGGEEAVMCLERQLMTSQAAHDKVHAPHWLRSKLEGANPKTSTAKLGTLQNSSPEESPGGGSTPNTKGSETPGADKMPGNLSATQNSIRVLEVEDMSDAGERGERLGEEELAEGGIPGNDSQLSLNGSEYDDDLGDPEDKSREEHVVEIHECPICHMPRLTRGKRTTDADIITHIATCASSDWRAVNNLVMAGFVTSSQAQRKWYSKVISKVSYGGYKLGANSANILVQDRLTGLINEERMSVYVRLGIRLLYKSLGSRKNMERKKIRKLLRTLSVKQGKKYDDPNSASQIPGFINFHQLDMGEVLLTTDKFRNFNEFFYRKLKPDARPCSAPNDPHIVVAPSDCRSVVFNRMEDAQRIWVKGREFSMERLLGDAYPQDAKRYRNGALGIMRLAPQDYHRFHIPVDGVMGEPKLIEGEYYTVNPMAIRSALDVYGENIRVVVPIDSEVHGRVMVVCVGAMMVGSTVITRKAGEKVKRAEELGYFKFGGSTLLMLFEPGMVKFDDDLVGNSNAALETLVRVGMSVGHSPDTPQYMSDSKKENPTQEEMNEGKRRIEGSLAPSTGTKGIDLAMKMK
ncbi:phosphatidylserine decarboxylase [Elasticomyces elasticus]|nr:phosphatidylserine decarboxylase [Elasticomyces elasticus]KAK5749424.1 phosphatidylserine decarboxylase [Elasticomyces elasticus]